MPRFWLPSERILHDIHTDDTELTRLYRSWVNAFLNAFCNLLLGNTKIYATDHSDQHQNRRFFYTPYLEYNIQQMLDHDAHHITLTIDFSDNFHNVGGDLHSLLEIAERSSRSRRIVHMAKSEDSKIPDISTIDDHTYNQITTSLQELGNVLDTMISHNDDAIKESKQLLAKIKKSTAKLPVLAL